MPCIVRFPFLCSSLNIAFETKKKNYEKMYDRMQIVPCISVMWIRCPVPSHRCTRFIFCQAGAVEVGVEGERDIRMCILYFPIFIMPKRTRRCEICIGRSKENHFSSRRMALNVQKLFSCNFYHRLTRVLCSPTLRKYNLIIFYPFSYRRIEYTSSVFHLYLDCSRWKIAILILLHCEPLQKLLVLWWKN